MKINAVIDRFEGTKAVLLVGDVDAQVVWPREYLPEDATEGDHIELVISIDHGATRSSKAEVEDLLRKLLDANEK